MAALSERLRRAGLAFFAFCWAVNAWAYLQVSDARRWAPDLAGWAFAAAATLTLAVAFAPRARALYRAAGVASVGALVIRLWSVAMGLRQAQDADGVWIILSGVATTGLLVATWARFWLTEVQPWHLEHRRAER